jgi:hypothetical protein
MKDRIKNFYDRYFDYVHACVVALLAVVAIPQLIGQDRAHAAIFVPVALLVVAAAHYRYFVRRRSSGFIVGPVMGTLFVLIFSLPSLISLKGTDLMWQWPALCGIFILMRRDYDQLYSRRSLQA